MPYSILVLIKYKDGHTETKELSRKAFLKIPMEQRRQVLTDQAEKFFKDNPNYFKELEMDNKPWELTPEEIQNILDYSPMGINKALIYYGQKKLLEYIKQFETYHETSEGMGKFTKHYFVQLPEKQWCELVDALIKKQ